MRTIKACTIGLASLLFAGFGANALAQDNTDEFSDLSSMMLEEIIVTARRREEGLQTVPVAVTAFSADDILSRSAIVISDIAKETPSLTIQSRTSDRNTQLISLRGQVQIDAVATLDPSVGVYLNDIYVARSNGANFELFDLDRVEVLAGPQGTLYGRNTTGGAIKLVTKPADPKGELSGYAALNGGNYNARRVEGAVNIPFNDKFAVRVAGLEAVREGYGQTLVGTLQDGIGFDGAAPFTVDKIYDTDDKNTRAGRLSATFLPTQKLSIAFVGDYSSQKTNGATGYNVGNTLLTVPPNSSVFGPLGLQPFGNYQRCSDDFYTTCENFAPKADAETLGAALTGAYETSIGVVKLMYGYRTVDAIYRSDLEGSPIAYESIVQPTNVEQNSAELQLQGQTASWDYTMGLYYFAEEGTDDFTDDSLAGLSKRFIGARVDNDSKSVYGQVGYSLTRTVRATVGLRYTEDGKGVVGNAFALPSFVGGPTGLCLYGDPIDSLTPPALAPSPTVENCRYEQHDTFSHLSWTAGIDWQPRDGLLAYLKTSEGYRSGGQNVRGITTLSRVPFKEETIRDIELGMKSRFYDRVQLNLTYYHSDYSDIQTTQFLPLPFPQNTTTIVRNQGTAKIDGVELQSTLIASDNLSFDITGSYNNFKFELEEFVPALTPRFKGSLGANIFLPVAYGDWSARMSYSWQSSLLSTPSSADAIVVPESELASRGLLDARIAVSFREYDTSVALFGTNLTNKKYFEFVQLYTVTNPFNESELIDAFSRLQVGAPRMYGLEIRKRF